MSSPGYSHGLSVCGYAESLVPLVRSRDSVSSNELFKGFAVLPDGQTRSPVIVKVFPQQESGLRIYNEVIAHHLAVQCGLMSPYTFPCTCLASDLRRDGAAAKSRDGKSEFALGVASHDLSYKKLNQSVRSSEALEQDILLWPGCARAAVFDELVANSDRHASNLIRQGAADYRIIDHERIMFGEHWFDIEDLRDYVPRNSQGNCLAQTIAKCTDDVLRQRLRHYAQIFMREVSLSVPAVSAGIERLCHTPPGTTDRLVGMLNLRMSHLPRLIQFYFADRDLFRASSRQ